MNVKFTEGLTSAVFLAADTVSAGEKKTDDIQYVKLQSKLSIVTRPAFIGGCSVGMILAGALLGFLMAKRKIKKDLD